MVFTTVGVSAVSFWFRPVRKISLCWVKTPAKPLGFVVWLETLRIETPLIAPRVALIEVYPAGCPPLNATLVAEPLEFTVATAVLEDVQVAVSVKSCVVPSE